MIEALIDELAQLERAGDLAAALKLLGARPLRPNELATVAVNLYRRDLSALAFLIAQQLLKNGIENWMLHALAAHLALRLGQTQAAAPSIQRLTELFADADAAQRDAAHQLLEPFLPRDAVYAFHGGNHALNRGYAQLWSAIEPQTRPRLALPAAMRPRDIARLLVPSDPQKLLGFTLPPADGPRSARKAVLGMRHRWFPDSPSSREHDIPVRYATALEEYGWLALRHDLRSLQDDEIVAADYQALAALCHESKADLLILDEFQPSRGDGASGAILRTLRREMPALRIVSIYMDPWLPEHWDDIENGADCLDAAWSLVVTPVWHRPAFAGKTLFLPFPHGGSYPIGPALQQPGFRFSGGVQLSNWDRAFWLAAIAEAGLPVRVAVSRHQEDALGPLESYRAYMRQSAGEAALNFARRSNGMLTLTGRTFETLATGGLLVQERSDDIDRFFVAGRHYLRFETLADLFDIAELLLTEPAIVESIRQEGAAFFRERYSDEKLIAYLDHFLFHRESARAAA